MHKILNTVIRNCFEQYRQKVIAWLISNSSDVMKFFFFVEIKSFNGQRVESEIINWSADVNGRSKIVGLKYKNWIFIELFLSNLQKFADFIPIFVF